MEKNLNINENQDDNKVKLEEKNEIEFYYKYSEELPEINLQFVCVPFSVSNINEENRDEIFESYKAFLACGNGIDEESGVGKVIVDLAQKNEIFKDLSNVKGAGYRTFLSRFMGRYRFNIKNWFVSPDASHASIARIYFKLAQLMLVDGYCDKKMKDGVVKFVEENEDFRKRVVLIKRYYSNGDVVDKEGTEALEKLLPEENVIKGSDYVTLSKRARELYVEIFQSVLKENGIFKTTENKLEKLSNKANDNKVDLFFKKGEYIEIKKNKFRKLFDKFKENKVKTVSGLVVFATLEELLRRSFFGGSKQKR